MILQAVALVPVDIYKTPTRANSPTSWRRRAGCSAASHAPAVGATKTVSRIDDLLDRIFVLARERDLDVDLHVDESGDPTAAALPAVARATLRHRYEGRFTCGHC